MKQLKHKNNINATQDLFIVAKQLPTKLERRKSQLDFEQATIKTKQVQIIPRSPNQYFYLKNILLNMILILVLDLLAQEKLIWLWPVLFQP